MSYTIRTFTVLFAILACGIPCRCQSVADILEHARPAVVTILTQDAKGKSNGLGSGFIVREDGVVLTAWHVVSDAATANIKMQDGKTYAVKGVLAKNEVKDFALLKVEAQELPVLPLGDSDHVRQGDRILTLGSPQGLEETASEGMVSAVRNVDKTLHLQITAPISHGNSGGPVLNAQGEAVGIAVFYLKDSQNLNFAIAINEVKPVLARASELTSLPAYVSPENARFLQLSADKLFRLGDAAFTDRNYESATQYFDAVWNKRPDLVGAWYMAARARSEVHDLPGAISRLRGAIQHDPRFGLAYLDLGRAYIELTGHDAQAAWSYTLAARYAVSPADKCSAFYGLAKAEASRGHYEDSVRAYKFLITFDPKDQSSYFGAGFAYERLSRHKDADTMFAKGLKLNHNGSEVWTELGDAWTKCNDDGFGFGDDRWIRASEAYKRAIQYAKARRKREPMEAYIQLGEIYRRLQRWPQVIKICTAALRISEDYLVPGYVRQMLCEAYLKLDDLGSAEAQYAILHAGRTPSAAEGLLIEIAQYGVPRGKVRVKGVVEVMVHLSKAQAESTSDAAVFADGKRLHDDAFPYPPSMMVTAVKEFDSLDLTIRLNGFSDGPHRVDVVIMDKSGTEISRSKLNFTVNNIHPDDTYTVNDFTFDIPVAASPH